MKPDPSPPLEQYDREIRCYSSATLRDRLGALRKKLTPSASATIHDGSWAVWRKNAGLVSGTGKDQIRTKSRFLTQREAALIVLQALWKPANTAGIVKKTLGSNLDSKDLNSLRLPGLFDDWVAANGCAEAADLLHEILGCPLVVSGRDLSDLSVQLLGGRAAIATIRVWAGKAIAMNNRPVDREVAVKVIRRMIDRAEHLRMGSERN